MSLDRYELLSQRGAGLDGAAFAGRVREDGSPVEVRLLEAARRDPVRWADIVARLHKVALIDHPGLQLLREMSLQDEQPFVVLEATEGPNLVDAQGQQRPLTTLAAVALTLDLASVVLAGHRIGLAHGRLHPTTVRYPTPNAVKIDFTALDTGPSTAPDTEGKAGDVFALGSILVWLLDAEGDDLSRAPVAVQPLLAEMLAADPDKRPTMANVEQRLMSLLITLQDQSGLSVTRAAAPPSAPASPNQGPKHLGRFVILEKLGQGGMGAVYKARDRASGQIVAIKVLLPEYSQHPDAMQRFLKEARLLAEVQSPWIANLLDINEDGGIHYIAVDFVAGPSLGKRLEKGEALEEHEALEILADVCRGLAEAHARGIVHRDIKPDNILLAGTPVGSMDVSTTVVGPRVLAKLVDFGLARHVVESESLALTRTGTILGTPLYLSPEQCIGGTVDARSDVYGLGATLFQMLTGRPPFLGDNPLALINQHTREPPPPLRSLKPDLSEGVAKLVEKTLAKSPEHRHPDASGLLRDIERLLRGEPTTVAVHPVLPQHDPGRVVRYDYTWELESSPEQLWPHVSNTERLNRAIGLPAVNWTAEAEQGGKVHRHGKFRRFGVEAAWEEHPFEWIEARRFGVLRVCSSGPFRWLLSMVELQGRAGGGTTLKHSFRLEPTGLLGRTVAGVTVGINTRRGLDRVYRRIDAAVRGTLGTGGLADPFEEPARLSSAKQKRLDELIDRISEQGVPASVVERLGDYLSVAPPQEIARIRPVALARRLGLDAGAVIDACLHGAREGLLELMWDLICPICRIPSQMAQTLRAVREHGHCQACNMDYELDFSKAVELVFRLHPSIREVELGVFCIGGPAHSPHVVAQLRLAPKERIELDLNLSEGMYRFRGPQLPTVLDVRVEPGEGMTRWEIDLGRLLDYAGNITKLRPGGQQLVVSNPHDQELVVRLERTAQRDDALTAARAATLSLFRELFPGEVLTPGQLVGVSAVTLLWTELAGAGYEGLSEAQAFARLHEHIRLLETLGKKHSGTLVKAVGDGGLMAFHEPGAAVRAAQELARSGVKMALHRGSALATTINDQLDYFGLTVRQTAELLRLARAGQWIVSQAVLDDPTVPKIDDGRLERANLSGKEGAILYRIG